MPRVVKTDVVDVVKVSKVVVKAKRSADEVAAERLVNLTKARAVRAEKKKTPVV